MSMPFIGTYFVPYPQAIWDEDIRLSLPEFRLLGYLLRHQVRLGQCIPSITYDELMRGVWRANRGGEERVRLDRGCGLSRNAIKKAIQSLIQRTWIAVKNTSENPQHPVLSIRVDLTEEPRAAHPQKNTSPEPFQLSSRDSSPAPLPPPVTPPQLSSRDSSTVTARQFNCHDATVLSSLSLVEDVEDVEPSPSTSLQGKGDASRVAPPLFSPEGEGVRVPETLADVLLPNGKNTAKVHKISTVASQGASDTTPAGLPLPRASARVAGLPVAAKRHSTKGSGRGSRGSRFEAFRGMLEAFRRGVGTEGGWGRADDRALGGFLSNKPEFTEAALQRCLENYGEAVAISRSGPAFKGYVNPHVPLSKMLDRLPLYIEAPVDAFNVPLVAPARARRPAASRDTGFDSVSIARYLQSNAAQLDRAAATLPAAAETASRLRELAANLEAENPNLEDLDRTLTVLEEKLAAALLAAAPEAELTALRAQADRGLAPYRSKMQAHQIEQVQQQLLYKRLLQTRHLPRLGLVYMPHHKII